MPSLHLHLFLIVPWRVIKQQRAVCPWWSGDKYDVTNVECLWHIYVCVAPICMQIKGSLPVCSLHLILSFCVRVCVCLKCMHVMVCCLSTNLGLGYSWPFMAFEQTQDTHTGTNTWLTYSLHKTCTHTHAHTHTHTHTHPYTSLLSPV